MKSFARRSSKSKNADTIPDGAELLDLDELDIAPLGTTEPTASAATANGPVDAATAENDEFVERLGDLDRFIGGAANTAPPSWSAPSLTRNLPAAPTGALAPISHPRPPAPASAVTPSPATQPADTEDEAREFLDRLGDLDRFIGGAPAPAAQVPADPRREVAPADAEDEAREFLDRLGDLDRFIGGSTPPEQ